MFAKAYVLIYLIAVMAMFIFMYFIVNSLGDRSRKEKAFDLLVIGASILALVFYLYQSFTEKRF